MLTLQLHPVMAFGLLTLVCTGASVVVDCLVNVVPRPLLLGSVPLAVLFVWAWVTR